MNESLEMLHYTFWIGMISGFVLGVVVCVYLVGAVSLWKRIKEIRNAYRNDIHRS